VSRDFTNAVITGDIPPAVASIVRAFRRDAGTIGVGTFETMIKGDLDNDVESNGHTFAAFTSLYRSLVGR
jgi:hypothetical protein